MTDTHGLTQAFARAVDASTAADQQKRRLILAALDAGATYREVADATGLSTNTLQRWKMEANR